MTDENGLYYMRARFYSPEIKRFVNMDVLVGEVGVGQSLNRFAFVTGRPVSLVDPFGLAQEDLNRAIDIVKTFLPPIYNDQVQIKFGNTFKWWNPRHWLYQLRGESINGYTISGNPITILIDNNFSQNYFTHSIIDGRPLRVAQLRDLLEAVIHEYQHAFDYQRYWAEYYDWVIIRLTYRHRTIYSSSNFIANLFEKYMYLTEAEWQIVKDNMKQNSKQMTNKCYDSLLH
jgi:RHS repeat-associated protein